METLYKDNGENKSISMIKMFNKHAKKWKTLPKAWRKQWHKHDKNAYEAYKNHGKNMAKQWQKHEQNWQKGVTNMENKKTNVLNK